MNVPLNDWNGSKNVVTEMGRMDKKNTQLQTLIIVISLLSLLVSVFGFYWFSYRPEKIRANCMAEAELNPATVAISNDADRQMRIDTSYKNCIRAFGLE
jgi:hypothetical protein